MPRSPDAARHRDAHVARLARLFRDHPVWRDAARRVDTRAQSDVRFAHLPDERFHLCRRRDRTHLVPGPARDPDFAFVFTPAAVDRLAAVQGDLGDFAVTLFELAVRGAEDDAHVEISIRASFQRLVRRGYLRLLLDAGPGVLRFGAAHGVASLGALRALVGRLRG